VNSQAVYNVSWFYKLGDARQVYGLNVK